MNLRMFSNARGSSIRRARVNPLVTESNGRTACGDWRESSFDLTRGVEVIEGLSVEEFERCGGRVKTPGLSRPGR
jgi:hypothetical protein